LEITTFPAPETNHQIVSPELQLGDELMALRDQYAMGGMPTNDTLSMYYRALAEDWSLNFETRPRSKVSCVPDQIRGDTLEFLFWNR